MRRVQAKITLVEKDDQKWLVHMKSLATGRNLYMRTSKNDYCRGQTVKLTCKSVSKDGELERPRFSEWIPFHLSITATEEEKKEALTEFFSSFRDGVGRSKKNVKVEGGFEVELDKRSWFIIYHEGKKIGSSPLARDAADRILKWNETT